MKNIYPQGNKELLSLIRNRSFDRGLAEPLIAEIKDLNSPIMEENDCSTTYLYEAQAANNLEAVRLLLEYGADPNYCNEDLTCECALSSLQFCADDEKDNPLRYRIAKLFFQYGADPNLECDGETIYDGVTYEVYNEVGCHGWRYLVDFYKLLVAYGGGTDTGYGKPTLSQSIDLERIDDYQVKFFQCDDGYHVGGYLLDPDGIVIGEL